MRTRFLDGARWRGVSTFLAAAGMVITQTADAASVRVYVLSPSPPNSLDWIEQHGAQTPWFQRDFFIPYNVVEALIRDAIRAKVDGTKSGTVVCTDPCPDVDWSVTVKSDFSFTQTGQPVVKAFGDPQQNGVDISVHAQMRLRLDIHVHAETWLDSNDGDFPVEILIGVDASSKLNLWPAVQSQDFKFDLTLDQSNIDLTDLHGAAIKTGAKLGVLIGFTPLGMALGGPAGLGILLAVLGEEAAKVAEQKIKAEADKALNDLLSKAEEQIKTEVAKRVDPAIAQANNIKDQLLNTPLPGVGKSFQDLSSALGLTLDVQTTTPSGNVDVIVTPRFSASPGSGKIEGKLRLPKEQCVYLSNPIIGFVPVGLQETNQELASKIGAECASLFNKADFKVSAYMGGDPAVVTGAGAVSLPNWKLVGSPSLTGTLSSGGAGGGSPGQSSKGYYECNFQISALPNAAFIELAESGDLGWALTAYYSRPSRYLEVSGSGQQLVLDKDWNQVAVGPQAVAIGGAGKCLPGTGGVGERAPWWQLLKDRFDPERCPQCGIRLKGKALQVSNPEPILRNPELRATLDAIAGTRSKKVHIGVGSAVTGGPAQSLPQRIPAPLLEQTPNLQLAPR